MASTRHPYVTHLTTRLTESDLHHSSCSQKKAGQAETKPYTNFGVFHDNLISRLKSLSQIQQDFEKRAKEGEARYTEKLSEIRKSLDQRWRQLDKFETSVKQYADTKTTWRRKLSAKEGELEAAKVNMQKVFF